VVILSVSRPPTFTMASKIKALKDNLRTWNEPVFDNVESLKKITFGGAAGS
jgi:hypothetical protein